MDIYFVVWILSRQFKEQEREKVAGHCISISWLSIDGF